MIDELNKIDTVDGFKIENLHFWTESSNAIEHWFKKYGGYPIPNEFIETILNKHDGSIILDADGVHYSRAINGELHKKMMFGFNSEETYKHVTVDYEDYLGFRDRVNSIGESYCLYESYSSVENDTMYLISDMDNAADNHELTMLTPDMKSFLENAIIRLNHLLPDGRAMSCIHRAKWMLDEFPMLELHTIKF